MNEQPPKRKSPWSSLLSLLVFVLVIAGRPLASLVNQLLNTVNTGSISIPWPNAIPFAVGALIIAGAAVVIMRVIGSAAAGPQLPTQTPYRLSRSDPLVPAPPRFDPVVSPVVVLIGIVGLLLIGGIALAVVLQAAP